MPTFQMKGNIKLLQYLDPHERAVLAIIIYEGVHMKRQTQAQKYGFTVNFAPKNIVILHIFYPKIWVTVLF